jgi:imidazolonepropionase
MRLGTGAIEIKSGYGLTIDGELKSGHKTNVTKLSHIHKSNVLGAHAIPLEYKDNRKGYIDLLIKQCFQQSLK